MQYVELGATGLRVSRLAVGTAVFGLPKYGIPSPGDEKINPAAAIESILFAADNGVNFFDTAPGYGCSEDLLGRALLNRRDCVIATKVAIPADIAQIGAAELARRVNASLENSLRALRREVLDVVQIHNATTPVLKQGDMISCLERAREKGNLRYIGCSVYGEDTALTALATGNIQVLQVALSVLDQRMRAQVLPAAKSAGVGVVTRSAFLKGALTERAAGLPEHLHAVFLASERVLRAFNATWESLPSLAFRFCLSLPDVNSVLTGGRNCKELQPCLAAIEAGPLAPEVLQKASRLALDDDRLLNPTHWHLEDSDFQQARA